MAQKHKATWRCPHQDQPIQTYVYLQGPLLELYPVKDIEGGKASHAHPEHITDP